MLDAKHRADETQFLKERERLNNEAELKCQAFSKHYSLEASHWAAQLQFIREREALSATSRSHEQEGLTKLAKLNAEQRAADLEYLHTKAQLHAEGSIQTMPPY